MPVRSDSSNPKTNPSARPSPFVSSYVMIKRFGLFGMQMLPSAFRSGVVQIPKNATDAVRTEPQQKDCVLPPPAEKKSGRVAQCDLARLPFHLGRERARTTTTFTLAYVSAKTLSSFHRADVIQILVNVQIQSKRSTNAERTRRSETNFSFAWISEGRKVAIGFLPNRIEID